MNKLLNQSIEIKKVLPATLIVFSGLAILLFFSSYIAIFSLAVTSYIAFIIVYSHQNTKALFSKPVNPVRNIFFYFVLNWVVSMSVALTLNNVFGWHLRGNAVNDKPGLALLIILPIMIMGEELFSMYFLSVFSSKFKLWIASCLSAVVFGLIHFTTYYNGDIFKTLIHILLIQGSARLIFNRAAIKSNSIWTSWIIHLLFDFSSILVVLITQFIK